MTKRVVSLCLAVLMLLSFVGCKKTPADDGSSVDVEYQYVYETDTDDADNGDNDNSAGDSNTGKDNSGKGNSNNDNSAGDSNTGKDDSGKGNSGNANTNKGNSKLEGNTYTSGFPIVKKNETLKIMAITRADVGDVSKSQFDKEYSQMTNIDIEWDLVTEGEANQRKTLALQSGNMPDIFALSSSYMSDADILQYSNEGAFVEITKDMLKKWAPNIYATYDEYNTWKNVKDSNGKMYTIAGYTKDYPWGQHFVWVRKTWLKKLGMSTPKTMDDFYKMLVAFKNNDPNGNGQKDEVPYATFSSGGFFTNSWGFNGTFGVTKKGKVTCMYTTQNMKNALTYWNRVYKEGLVDTKTINSYSGNYAAFKTLLSGGKVGAFYYGYPNEGMDDKLLSEYEPIVWPTAGNNGDFPSAYVEVTPVESRTCFIITKSCKNVPAALRWLDYLYTNDGYMLKAFGKEGDRYEKVNNNTYKMISEAKSGVVYGPNWTLRGRHFLEGAKIEQETSLITKLRGNCNTALEKLYKSSGQKMMPQNFKTKSEIQQQKLYSTYFNSLSSKQYEFIKGTLNLNSDYTALQNEISSKGLDAYLKSLQSYYDRCN